MANMKTVYTITGLNFEEKVTFLFGLQAREAEVEKLLATRGLSETGKEYWTWQLELVRGIQKRWHNSDFNKYEYVEVPDEVEVS